MHTPTITDDGHEGNGTNPLQGSPWWVRAVWILGAPTLIAMGLTYWIATSADDKLGRIDTSVSAASLAAAEHDRGSRSNFQRLESRQDETLRILTAVCVNAAKDEAARNRCLGR